MPQQPSSQRINSLIENPANYGANQQFLSYFGIGLLERILPFLSSRKTFSLEDVAVRLQKFDPALDGQAAKDAVQTIEGRIFDISNGLGYAIERKNDGRYTIKGYDDTAPDLLLALFGKS